MKHNPKEVINIITLVQEFIETLNSQCVQHKVNKIYEIKIVDGIYTPTIERIKEGEKAKKCKTIKLTVVNLDTNERLTIFDASYVVNNPADLIKVDYKRKLYRELLYNAIGIMAFNLENVAVQNAVTTRLNDPKTFADTEITEQSVTPTDEISSKDFSI
jgi:hypothetical protein